MGACQTKEVVCKVQGLGKRIFICFAVTILQEGRFQEEHLFLA